MHKDAWARRWDLPTLAGQSASGATADLLRAPRVARCQQLSNQRPPKPVVLVPRCKKAEIQTTLMFQWYSMPTNGLVAPPGHRPHCATLLLRSGSHTTTEVACVDQAPWIGPTLRSPALPALPLSCWQLALRMRKRRGTILPRSRGANILAFVRALTENEHPCLQAVYASATVNRMLDAIKNQKTFCPPAMNTFPPADIVCRVAVWLGSHPTLLDKPSDEALSAALVAMYPCR
jgi:hypothetical protein